MRPPSRFIKVNGDPPVLPARYRTKAVRFRLVAANPRSTAQTGRPGVSLTRAASCRLPLAGPPEVATYRCGIRKEGEVAGLDGGGCAPRRNGMRSANRCGQGIGI